MHFMHSWALGGVLGLDEGGVVSVVVVVVVVGVARAVAFVLMFWCCSSASV